MSISENQAHIVHIFILFINACKQKKNSKNTTIKKRGQFRESPVIICNVRKDFQKQNKK